MKRAAVFLVAGLIVGLLGSEVLGQDVYVRPYFRRDGAYVQPHYRSRPDGNVWNNYSTYGNINPYTGEIGRVNPYRPPTVYPSPYVNPYSGYQRRYYGY